MNFNYESITKITKLNEEQQNTYLRFLSRVHVDLKLDILSKHKKIFYQLQDKFKEHLPLNLLSYCALIKSIQITAHELEQLNHKNYDEITMDEIRKISSKKAKLFISKQYRIKTKSEKLLNYWAIVKTLKNDENFSYRMIADYLNKYHKLKIAHSTISILWNKLEG